MSKIFLDSGSILNYTGDGLVIFCNVLLSYKRANSFTSAVLSHDDKDLMIELASIGYCEIGNAVITQGYSFKVNHFIFVPYKDSNNPENTMDQKLLHQSLNSVFNLIRLYKLKTVGFAIPQLKTPNIGIKDELNNLLRSADNQEITSEIIIDVIKSFSRDLQYPKTINIFN